MTIREMIEALEAIEKEHGNVNVVNGYKPHGDEDETVKIYFHKKGDKCFNGLFTYTKTEVEIF